MSAWWAYALGLVTLPVGGAAVTGWFRLIQWLDDRHGIAFELKGSRGVSKIDDYTLRKDIWWERSFGVGFVGHWCHETYIQGRVRTRINRWVGIGPQSGPCLMVFKKRNLS